MNWTVSRRISVAFTGAVLGFVIVGATGAWALRRAVAPETTALAVAADIVDPIYRASANFSAADAQFLAGLLDPADARHGVLSDSLERVARQLLDTLDAHPGAGMATSSLRGARRALDEWSRMADSATRVARAGRMADALKIRTAAVEPALNRGTAALTLGVRAAQSQFDSTLAESVRAETLWTNVMIAVVVVMAFLGALAGVLLRRAVLGPVTEATSVLASAASEIQVSTSELASGSAESASAIAETMTSVAEIAQGAERSAERARNMVGLMQKAADQGRQGRQTLDSAIEATERVTRSVSVTAERITELAERAQEVGELVAGVSDIAEQTNILALNAAVEAARAGEQGKGFAVVAGEVRRLADSAKRSAAQVRGILGDIQRSTGAAVMATEQSTKETAHARDLSVKVLDAIAALDVTVGGAATAATQIQASVEQQSVAMGQVDQAMTNINTAATQNVVATEQLEQAGARIAALGVQLDALVGARRS